MTHTNDTAKQDWREYRRLRVWEMHRQGYKQNAIAAALGLSREGVSHILARAQAGGEEALRQRKLKGAQARLTPEQKAEFGYLPFSTLLAKSQASVIGRNSYNGMKKQGA